MGDSQPHVRVWGHGADPVILVHGGPAAPGTLAPVAQLLATDFTVLEAFQRGSCTDETLTVERHVADLHELIGSQCRGRRPALVGHSWGAMLVLAYGAAHPQAALPLVLIGCGTFDPAARAEFVRRRERGLTEDRRRRQQAIDDDATLSEAERMSRRGKIADEIYTYAPRATEPGEVAGDLIGPFDLLAHQQTWQDELRLQAEGRHPADFAAITSPVLMLHGSDDPHPGEMIRDCLQPHLPQLEYIPLQRCGHSPWHELHARQQFFSILTNWLKAIM